MSRLYTVRQADRTLPYVAHVVAEVRERYRAIRELGRRHNRMPRTRPVPRADLRARIRAEADRLHGCLEELERLGIEIKDYERGLVDFPALFEGRRILLCWRHGEPRVAYWHGPREGYGGRRPVPAGVPDWPGLSVGGPAGRD